LHLTMYRTNGLLSDLTIGLTGYRANGLKLVLGLGLGLVVR